MCDYNNTTVDKLQDFYISSKTGEKKERPWRVKKMANELLALAYDEFDSKKAARLRGCCSSLTFRVYDDGTRHLDSMDSCRVRLCPMCAWRRSLKNFYNNYAIAEYLEKNGGGAWIALTLTVRSDNGENLSQTIDDMFYAYNKFVKNKRVKAVLKGFYRGLEVTHDCREFITKDDMKRRGAYLKPRGFKIGDRNPTFDLFHPHFHVLVHVNKSYFSDTKHYLSAEQWSAAWQQALAVDYVPSVKIQRVKDFGTGLNGSIAEISKYSVKSADYIYPDDWDLTVETVKLLDGVLANRRLIAYGGDCRAAKSALKLQDADNGDLVDVGGEKPPEDKPYTLQTYFWHTGYRQYIK